MERRYWILVLTLGAIWGASYLLIKIGLRDLSPELVAFLRIALAAAVLVPFAASQGAFAGLRQRLGWLVLLGFVQVAGPFWLISAGEEEISSALAGILVACSPLFTAVIAVAIDHEERSEGLALVGVLIGFAGVALLLGVDVGGSGSALLGGLMVVLASLGYAIAGFVAKHRMSGMAPSGVAAVVMVVASLALLAPALLTLPDAFPGAGPVAAVTALGVIGTGVAFVILYFLIDRVGPARAWIVTYVAPVFAVSYGAALLGEAITAVTIAGMALILAGSWLAAEGRLPAWIGSRARADAL